MKPAEEHLAVRTPLDAAGRLLPAVSAGILALPVVILFLAPLASLAGADGLEWLSREFFRKACHRMPERSFTIGGSPLAVCARCTGVYLGLLCGAIGALFSRSFTRGIVAGVRPGVIALLAAPAAIQFLFARAGLLADGRMARAFTILPLAAFAGFLLARAAAAVRPVFPRGPEEAPDRCAAGRAAASPGRDAVPVDAGRRAREPRADTLGGMAHAET